MKDKKRIQDLALFGGPALFRQPQHVGRPSLPDRQRLFERISACLDRRQLTNKGPNVLELEREIAAYLGVKHCVAICNGTAALEILIRALGLSGKVIVPSFTFVATAHALSWLGLEPVFCDIDPRTLTIDPAQIEPLITEDVTGIIGVHLWGHPCSIDALGRIARRHRLKLAFDAAHAFGVSTQGRMIGSFGDAEVFSFHATKFYHTFEGGAVTTNNDALADKLRLMRNFGFKGYDNVLCVGTNGKMNEICAAAGLTMLEDLDKLVSANRCRYQIYRKQLSGIDDLEVIAYDEQEKANYQYMVVQIDDAATGLQRDEILRLMHAENILARRYFYPGCHRMPPYESSPTNCPQKLVHTERLCRKVICLPTGSAISESDVRIICRFLKFIFEHSRELNQEKRADLISHLIN